jgi:hypothetical protein
MLSLVERISAGVVNFSDNSPKISALIPPMNYTLNDKVAFPLLQLQKTVAIMY